MERLPYIDTHRRDVFAPPAETWSALLSALPRGLGGDPPALFIRAWNLEPASRRGSWNGTLAVGVALPGFMVDDVIPAERLALTGHHRFSRYALTFELAEIDGGAGTRISAETRAVFPGVLGRGYRAVVIGSGGHHILVRRLLRRISERL